MKVVSTARLSAITRMFSSAVWREMARKGRSGLFRRLLEQADLVSFVPSLSSVGDAFEAGFSLLKLAGYRDEYVYRAAISQKLLLGRHSLRTASILNEFRIGRSKADLVLLNGTATVYEIKSERDSLVRLARQVENYRRVFAKVNVIASEGHVKGVLGTVPGDVGVMCLSRRYQIRTVREAHDCPDRICPTTVSESLRMGECVAILRDLGIVVPDVPNTRRRAIVRSLFSSLDPVLLHAQMVRTLKHTRDLSSLADFIGSLPKSLRASALSIPIRSSDQHRLLEAISTPLDQAMTWS